MSKAYKELPNPTRRPRRGGHHSSVNLDYMISDVCFPSIEDATFRLISVVKEDGFSLKIEKVKASQQWHVDVNNLETHGPSGLPKEAVMAALKVFFFPPCCNIHENSIHYKVACSFLLYYFVLDSSGIFE
jgi:hypothetical protein